MRLKIRYSLYNERFLRKKIGEAEAWFVGCEGYTELMILMDDNGKIFSIERCHIISGKWIKDDAILGENVK